MKHQRFFSYGVLILAAVLISFGLSGCGSSYTAPTMPGGTFTSTTTNGHYHTFALTQADVQSPPAAGISGNTSSASGHTHTVTLTQAQLQQINAGTSVTITTGSTDSAGGPHTHDFTIRKWF